ncbi:hypothetical protein Tco_0215492 [Tanacetum coccineum]
MPPITIHPPSGFTPPSNRQRSPPPRRSPNSQAPWRVKKLVTLITEEFANELTHFHVSRELDVSNFRIEPTNLGDLLTIDLGIDFPDCEDFLLVVPTLVSLSSASVFGNISIKSNR